MSPSELTPEQYTATTHTDAGEQYELFPDYLAESANAGRAAVHKRNAHLLDQAAEIFKGAIE